MYHSQIRIWICETYIEYSEHIYIEHRNPETRKHLTISSFRYETFYYLWVKGFDIRKRDTHSFYSGLSICPPSRAAPVARKIVWPLRTTKIDPSPSVSSSQLNWLFFSKSPKSSARAFGAWRHSHSLAPFPIWAIVTSLSDTYAPRARTPALTLHLSNPCTEPKGSQPN